MPCSRLSRIFLSVLCLVALCLPAAAPAQPSAFRRPQFVATTVGFKALHETHWNWMGSDEVYALLYDFTKVRLRRTATFGDVDAGETRNFLPGDACISPQPTCDRGATGLAFGIALYEQDQPPFQFCHGALDPSTPPTPEEYERSFDAISGNCDDDLIGRAKVKLIEADLVTLVPTVGASVDATVPVSGGAGRYEFTYRITRLPNAIDIPNIGPAVEALPQITLTAMVTSAGGPKRVVLTWSGATTASVDIYRNAAKIMTTANDGSYDDQVPAGTYQYRVCDLGLTTACSAVVSIVVT